MRAKRPPQSEEPKPTAETPSEVAETVQPETEASAAPAINNLDVEKHAKSWQVGREKLKRISRILQCPFEDRRLNAALDSSVDQSS
jgi:hypothetical protein